MICSAHQQFGQCYVMCFYCCEVKIELYTQVDLWMDKAGGGQIWQVQARAGVSWSVRICGSFDFSLVTLKEKYFGSHIQQSCRAEREE